MNLTKIIKNEISPKKVFAELMLAASLANAGAAVAAAEAKPEIRSLKENIIATTEDAPISRIECLVGGLPENSTIYMESLRNFQTDKTTSIARLETPVYESQRLRVTAAVKYTNGVKTKTEEELGVVATLKGKKGSFALRYFPEGNRFESFGSLKLDKKISIDQLSTLNRVTNQASFRPAINYAFAKDKALRIEASYAGYQNNLKKTYVGAGVQFKLK